MEAKPTNETLSLSDLIKSNQATAEEATVEVEKSPLERMKDFKESNPGGLVVEKKDVTYDNEQKEFLNSIDDDKRRKEDFDNYMSEYDDLIETAQSVQMAKPITNPLEAAAAIDQLDRLTKERKGVKAEAPMIVDRNGEKVKANVSEEELNGTNLTVPRSDNGSFFKEKSQEGEGTLNTETPEEAVDNEIAKNKAENKKEEDETKRQELVKVLVDKTGFGTQHIKFTDEERKKLTTATEIRVTEVEDMDLSSIEFVAPDKNYVDSIEPVENEIGGTIVPLVSSHYRAKMKPLSYSQIGDLFVDSSAPRFETYYKSYSTIYNNLGYASCGKFDSFEDFLKSTSRYDMEMLLYGLIVSSYPEIDNIGLVCSQCEKSYPTKYVVRDLFTINTQQTEYLEKLDALMSASPEDFKTYMENSPVKKRKYIKLPNSGYLVEFGLYSAYDYLYSYINNIGNNKLANDHPDDINDMLKLGAVLLEFIHSIAIPTKTADGKVKYTKYSGFEDMIQILYRLNPVDYQLIGEICNKFMNTYQPVFTIKNTRCPHCNSTFEETNVSLYDVVFFRFRQLMSTEINVVNMPLL